MRSMTGFGRGSHTDEKTSIAVELKAVNNRFLDINLRLNGELQALEAVIKRQINARLKRGRVEVSIQYDRSDDVSYELNRPLITGYLAVLNELKEEFALIGEPDINVISRLPNVIQSKRAEPGEEMAAGVQNALSLALDDLEQMREKEGEMLKTELSAVLNEIESRLGLIETETGNVVEEYRQRLTKRIGEMLAKTENQIELDQARLAQEVAYLVDRSDISEEITRLRTHIEHFRTIMNEDKDVGKRLDFLTQELNREANTIASKTNNMQIKENALQIKSEIEKIREQVQNIE